VGPYNNPQETYNYHRLPFCRVNASPKHKWGGLGEILQGNELVESDMKFEFGKDVARTTVCEIASLSNRKSAAFARAAREHYWYEFVMDDLPVWGFVGENAKGDGEGEVAGAPKIYAHKKFEIEHNDGRITQVNLVAENPVAVTPGAKIAFTYETRWTKSDAPFSKRFERYLDNDFFEHHIHWFSIFNSCMMVIFLVGMVSMILMRTLRKDYAKYTSRDDDDDVEGGGDGGDGRGGASEESGWKLVHGDVFRAPSALPVLAAMLGTGVQLAALFLLVILITIGGAMYEGRGTILTVFIVCYALTSFVGGYVSGGFNARNEGKNWIKAMALTAGLFPGSCFAIAFALNAVAISYSSLAAVPFGTMVVMTFMWLFISFPLVLLGTVIGRNVAGAPNNPCRVKSIPRRIPEREWYLTPLAISLLGGVLPFGSIFIETYFVFTSMWNYKVYYVYGFFLLVFAILLIVTACVTVVATYFLLNAENWRWHWTAFNAAASVSLYVYAYSVYYFVFKTKMTGFFQTCFYFGYTAMFCLVLALVCGATGYVAANAFVRRIYRNIKCD
jgi:transmembrane 9 superfamily protein 3